MKETYSENKKIIKIFSSKIGRGIKHYGNLAI